MSKMKRFFNTYKNATLSTLCAAAILLLLGTSIVYAAGAVAESSAIGSDNAQNFAFADAGVDPVSAKMVRTEFDHELGQFVYEVEFTADGTEYEYWIKASDGTVLKKEVEIKEAAKEEPVLIELEAAKNIALKDAEVSADAAKFVKAELDYDDGIQIYDVEFDTATYEYEYEINATTGAVHDKSVEKPEQKPVETPKPAEPNPPAPSTTSNISIDRAKEIAVAQAGLSVSDVTFEKAKMEHEDGILVYEIEFYHGGMEYDCEIKASDGAVLDYDYEKED